MMPSTQLHLPQLWNAVLDHQTLHQLFLDLRLHAQVLEVHKKNSCDVQSDPSSHDLAELEQRFRNGSIHALQIRYSFEGNQWCDSLFHTEAGVKVVRMLVEPSAVAIPAASSDH